jgi:hypothetical protein
MRWNAIPKFGLRMVPSHIGMEFEGPVDVQPSRALVVISKVKAAAFNCPDRRAARRLAL